VSQPCLDARPKDFGDDRELVGEIPRRLPGAPRAACIPWYRLTSKPPGADMPVATTRLSSKGQVVIPETVRRELALKPGAEFVVVGQGDVVILKSIAPPDLSEFDALLRRAHRQARRAGVRKADVARVVRTSRARR
jgi:AbrB family looped-hinge helix DNA binding protein